MAFEGNLCLTVMTLSLWNASCSASKIKTKQPPNHQPSHTPKHLQVRGLPFCSSDVALAVFHPKFQYYLLVQWTLMLYLSLKNMHITLC